MRTSAIVRIILWSIVILVLVSILVIALAANGLAVRVSDTPAETETLVTDESPMRVLPSESTLLIDPAPVRELEIEWVAGSILIQPGDVEEITISESDVSDEKDALLWKQKGDKLTIQFCEEGNFSFQFGITVNTTITKDLTILVPRDWTCDSLEIDTASATVEVNDLTIREVDFDGASGTCEFENCTVSSIELDTASGDVKFYGSLDMLDFDGASGAITAVLANTPSRLDMDGMSGDMDITLPVDSGFAVTLNGMSTDFSSDFETTVKNGSYVHGDGRCRINVDAMSGDVIIRKAPAAVAHAHTEECTANPDSCPDNAHVHTDACTADPSSCPDNTEGTHHEDHK